MREDDEIILFAKFTAKKQNKQRILAICEAT